MVQIRVMTMQLAPILKVPTIALAILDTTEMERTAPVGAHILVEIAVNILHLLFKPIDSL